MFQCVPLPPSLPPLFHFAAVLHLLQHLDILQTHKGDIFEVNLPNKVTKIMAVPKKGTVREAIDPVMKKNNYSLEVMDLKFADTLKVYTRVCVCVLGGGGGIDAAKPLMADIRAMCYIIQL